ncbi:MAG: methyltransferase domain-containing protein [Candidatus Melainabacteria bacterium]|nr:methyltransferase domain-containing protein [Candidatus Melainabacteria bacterium]
MTQQLAAWSAEFGQQYTERNSLSPEDLDKVLAQRFDGVTKSDLFRDILLSRITADARILEVGSNIGIQLSLLRRLAGSLELYGVEPMSYAREIGKSRSPEIHFLPGSAFDIVFKDAYFDVVMTNGVLIHIHPSDLPRALTEIHRSTRRYIFLHEYYSESPEELTYRGNHGLMWKMNFMDAYLKQFADLQVVEVRHLRYANPEGGPDLVDQVCLLERISSSR